MGGLDYVFGGPNYSQRRALKLNPKSKKDYCKGIL